MTTLTNNHGLRGQDPRVLLITGVLVLANLAICIHRSSRLYMYQQSLCLQHYRTIDSSNVRLDWPTDESRCKIKQVQSTLSIIEGVDAFLQLLPGWLYYSPTATWDLLMIHVTFKPFSC